MKQPIVLMDEQQLIKQAVEALIEKLGVAETMRFLSLKYQDKFDSVTRHRRWQQQLNEEEFLKQVLG